MAVSDRNKELVRLWVDEIVNSKDLDACDRVIASDYTEHAAMAFFGRPAPGRGPGPATMRQTAQMINAMFPDFTLTIDAMIAEDDLVALRATARGTNLGPMGPMPPTGREFVAAQDHWFRIKDGKLAEHWATRDDLTSMLQLGVIVPPRPPGGPTG